MRVRDESQEMRKGWRAWPIVFVLLCAITIHSDSPAGWPQSQDDHVSASIVIEADKLLGSISPRLYGQFDEFMYEGVKGVLYAELLRDRGFDEAPDVRGLPRYWERDPDDRNDDPGLHIYLDDAVFYPPAPKFPSEIGNHSLRLDVTANDGQRRGIHQGGIPVRQGVAYHGYIWIKTSGFSGHINVALEADRTDGETYANAEIADISGDWKKYSFSLAPRKGDPLAKFSVLVYGPGRLWLDQLSLMPGDAVDGVRTDVFQKVKALRPAFIRWPGGNVAQDYHWTWGIGPRDTRPTWVNLSWGNEPEPSDFGTDEFLQFCHNVGAQPSITVNVEGRGGTAEEAAGWVEYVNGPPNSKFGAMRAANGHPVPYHVQYWEIGNEIWGTWVRGHSDAQTYAQNFNRYAAAMRAVDPSIRLIAVGDNNLAWDRTVLQLAGTHTDYLAIHHYYGEREMAGDPLNLMARPLHYEEFYKQLQKMFTDLVPGHEIRLAINEWNTSFPVPRQHSIEPALYAARLMNVFERSQLVAMSAPSDLINGWSGGLIQASRHGLYVTPLYLVNRLYSEHLGAEFLAARVESPVFDSSLEGKGVPYLDIVAERSFDGRQIFLKFVNTQTERAVLTTVELTGVRVRPEARLQTLTAASLSAANSFSTPDAISVQETPLHAGARFQVELPKHSVSVITLGVEGPQ